MMARIRKQMEKREEGFTLVELLVVIIIIGILAAIAIPLYLGQQAKAKDAALKSDLKNAQIEVANQLVDDPTGLTVTLPTIQAAVTESPGVTLTSFTINTATGAFKLCGTVTGGKDGKYCINSGGLLTVGT